MFLIYKKNNCYLVSYSFISEINAISLWIIRNIMSEFWVTLTQTFQSKALEEHHRDIRY